MGLHRSDLVELFELLAWVKFSILFGPESLDGHVDAFGVGPAKEFCQFASPVHGLLLDLNCFAFIR
jgi:hypothetical protein